MTRELRGMVTGRKKTEEGRSDARKIGDGDGKRLKSAGLGGLCPEGKIKNGEGTEVEGRRPISAPGPQAEGGTPKAGKPYKSTGAIPRGKVDGSLGLTAGSEASGSSRDINNNEQDEERCGNCRMVVGEEQMGIQCSCCEVWVHCECVGLDKTDYEYHVGRGNAEWFCRRCVGVMKGSEERMRVLEVENERLRSENREVINRLESLIGAVDRMRGEIVREVKRDIMDMVEERINNELGERMKDVNDRKMRECNVVVHGLPEGEMQDGDKCEEIFRGKLGVADARVENVVRLRRGRGNAGETVEGRGRVAPLLVTLRNAGQKWAVVGKAKNLRSSEDATLRRVMVVPDLSAKERETDRILREELKRRRDDGERDIYIKKGRIVSRNDHY